MTIYISLPITGRCERTQRRKARMIQRLLEADGHTVINPFDIGDNLDSVIYNPTYKQYMERDILAINNHADAIFLCNNWSMSMGCMDEVDAGVKKGVLFLLESTYKFT